MPSEEEMVEKVDEDQPCTAAEPACVTSQTETQSPNEEANVAVRGHITDHRAVAKTSQAKVIDEGESDGKGNLSQVSCVCVWLVVCVVLKAINSKQVADEYHAPPAMPHRST